GCGRDVAEVQTQSEPGSDSTDGSDLWLLRCLDALRAKPENRNHGLKFNFSHHMGQSGQLGDGDSVAAFVGFAGTGLADVGAAGEVLADRRLERARPVAVEDVDFRGPFAQAAV